MTTQAIRAMTESVLIPAAGVPLRGDLSIPHAARGIVAFAHGSGSSRHSPRNRYVAEILHERRLGTLLLDLLTDEEAVADAMTARLRFDITLLAARLMAVVDWISQCRDTRVLPVGLFGASTGAAAALVAAADRPAVVKAVVSRGGRPDLADDALRRVLAPTLLIVGGYDGAVIELNRAAMRQLTCEAALDIVPGATHLFEERGALDHVAELAGAWFQQHLRRQEKA